MRIHEDFSHVDEHTLEDVLYTIATKHRQGLRHSQYEEDGVGFRCHICSRPLISGQSDHQPIVAKEPENRPVRGDRPNDW